MTQDSTPSGRLKGRIALITGASRGLGFAAARRFAAEGAHVVALARTVGGLESLDDAIRAAGGACTLIPLDLRDGARIDALGASLHQRFGRLDILVGNAGVLGTLSPVSHLDPDVWAETFAINAAANQRLIRSLDPLLRQSAAGRAVFVSSRAVGGHKPYWSAYTASKAALEALAMAYAAETRQTSIRVNILRPGGVATAMRARAFPGEDPATLPQPEAMTDRFVDLTAAEWRDTGRIVEM